MTTTSAPRSINLAAALVLTASVAAAITPAAAQTFSHTPADWRQVETEHFLFVYPEELSGWTLDMARRMEAVHGAVEEMVGFAPEDRVTVLVDDPGNVSNGSMNPGPLLYMWPTPPNPRSMIGENRGWGEILAVHEFAHAAHLTRPSRNPVGRLIESVIPLPVTDIMRKTPRWAIEGYATYIEGRLTGSGRPHGVWRPAVLRTWALEGQLPTYGQVSGGSGFYGGSMAYLVGSAYLEWLVEGEDGDETLLPNVWRRLTARQKRSFDGAFTGVFGAPPAELYGHFTVDVTERALAVEDAVAAAGGAVDGELFQRLSWYVGDPAVSPDGARLAIRLDSRNGPSRLVVMATTPDTLPTKARERYEEIFEADPADVEPVRRRPRSQSPKATLLPTLGQSYRAPAWMPDGQGILVIRNDVEENGRLRPDLFLWRWDDGGLRRITRGAAIREAAPAPDGTWAVGLRCLHAACDIVRIELDDGAVTPLTRTDPLRPYYHPRVSPDGRTIVASVQRDGAWRLVAMNADGSGERVIGPDDGAARFDAEFLADGRLVLTSTLGGIHDIELLDPATGEMTPVTRVVGSAVAPTAGLQDASDLFFLSLHSRGWDLRRVPIDAPPAAPVVLTDPTLSPAATVPVAAADTFPAAALGPVRAYGLGPRARILLPMAYTGPAGYSAGLALGGTDPIGRFSWQLQGMLGTDRSPTGGALRLRYRGLRPTIHLEGFWTLDALTIPGLLPEIDDAFYGGFGALELQARRLAASHAIRLGASAARVTDIDANRLLGFGEYDLSLQQGPGHWRVTESLGAHGAVGRTGVSDWTRWIVSGGLGLRFGDRGLDLAGTVGGTDAAPGSLEAFSVGGVAPLLFDAAVLSQRVAMPALERGTLYGDRVTTWTAELHGVLPVTAFYWTGEAAGDGVGWYRVAGARLDLETPPIAFVRLPSVRIHSGLARLLDDPGEGDWRAWLMLGYTP